MSCDYIYRGRKYSKIGLLKVLAQAQSFVSEDAREFMRSKMGMLDSQIEIVQGLIDGKSLGRFLEDGDLLMSNMADDSVLYHEAFHRVFRMFLTPEEREQIYNDFKQRPDWKDLIQSYRKNYKTVEDQIEEFIADEFSDYVLNSGNLKTPYKSIFDRIIDFIKKMLGLKKRQISELYKDIVEGKYSGKPLDIKYRYARSVDKVTIGENNYSHDVKNDFIQAVSKEFISEVLKQGSVYDLISGKIGSSIQTELYKQSFVRIAEALAEDYPDMVNDFLDDFEKGPVDSYLNQQFKQYIETLVGKFDLNMVEESEQAEQENEVGEEEKGRPNDDANRAWTASIEIDPKTNMSKAIKLVLASFTNTDSVNNLGLNTNVRWTNAFNKIAQHLAGVPTQDSILHLSKLKEPWIQDLVEYLGGVNPEVNSIDSARFRLRNDFIKTFAKTRHTYMLAEVGKAGVKVFDANQNTQEKKKLGQWNDNMILAIKKASENGDLESWVKRLNTEIINSKTVNEKLYADLLGIDVNDELKNQIVFSQNGQDQYYASAMKTLASIIVKSISEKKFNNQNPPEWKSLFNKRNFDIEGTLKKLAEAQAEYEEVVDLMVFSRDKKLYGISQNTYTTTIVNTLNYISDLIDPNDTLENKLAVVEKYIPTILNYQTVDKVDGKYIIKSKWLDHILSGNKLNMVIVDGIKNELGDNEALADIDESDLFATTLNLSLRNINLSFKHSDRSVFYGYQMENSNIFDYQDGPYNTSAEIVAYLTTVLQSQLATEVKRANLKDLPLFQYFKDKYKDSQIFGLKNITELDPYSDEIRKMIKSEIQSNFDNYRNELIKWDVLDKPDGVQKGLSQDLIAYHNGSIDLAIASSFAAQMLTHLEEMKLFLGDFTFFKTAEDFYKRMSTTSGTGEMLVNDDLTNARIKQANDIEFAILNPRTGEMIDVMKYDKEIDGKLTSITLHEKDDYYMKDATELTEASPIDGSMISKVQYLFEWNALKDLGEVDDDAKKAIRKSSVDYMSNYQKINENDGQSYMNMFFFREYMMRLGSWSQPMENLFRAELKILKAKDFSEIKDLTISIGGEEVKIFDQDVWDNGWFESVHTLKSQYAGPTQAFTDYKNEINKDLSERVFPYTIYKTSYHVLWPSTVLGTNLSQMHFFMLKNKMDVIHMNSANKSGAIDAKAVFNSRFDELNEDQKTVAKHGLNFYDQYGHFNDFVFEGELGKQLLDASTSVADVTYLKDQVKIGNHEKDEIKGSTQSLKILLSNLMNNGVERFEGAENLINEYKTVINNIVKKSVDELLVELGSNIEGVQKLESLVSTIKRSAEDRSSPINIIEAIEGFLHDPYIESLPNKNKLENIFYSIITNNVVSFNRPGNSYPQVASTGFEKVGGREVGANMSISSSDELAFYSIETDENGNIVKVNPAEVIIPLPKEWIPSVLKAAKTNNIVEAIEWINERIANGRLNTEITFKGLRIPNQQLSSNDIFKVKRFNLPTNVNYAVVPTALVTKVGSDSIL
jgi:hypothetical protein